MKRQNSALRIYLYNRPVYLATWLCAAIGVAVGVWGPVPGRFAALATLPGVWSAISLVVSWYIYDRSALHRGTWLPQVLPPMVRHWATVHAGLDAEIELLKVMPGQCLARLDIFDPALMPAGSISRARLHTPSEQPAVSCPPSALALADASCDVLVAAFSAHELRDPAVREQFFRELRRCVRPGGRVILVEHVRDAINFLVFGPGYLHFLPRREWLRLATQSGLAVAEEKRVTPWVMVLSMEPVF